MTASIWYTLFSHFVEMLSDGIIYHRNPELWSNSGIYRSNLYCLPVQDGRNYDDAFSLSFMWDWSSPLVGATFEVRLDSDDPDDGIDIEYACVDLGYG